MGSFLGSGGWLSVWLDGYMFLPTDSNKDLGEQSTPGGYDSTSKNWIACMRSRKEPMVNVEAGHYAAMACHISNIAFKEKQRVTWRKELDF